MKKNASILLKSFLLRKKHINAPRQIVISFAAVILIGALLLMCPFSSADGRTTSFLSALFTATSATCVTGLVVEETGAYFSFIGQLIIILLIQIGGIGFMTILAITVNQAKKKMNVRNKMIVAQSLSVDAMADTTVIARLVLKLVLFFEGIGALILSVRFVPEFGFARGIWYGVFHSISAFCNAGFDVFGNGNSLYNYNGDIVVMTVIPILIILGGLGFTVFQDIYKKRCFKRLSVYSKLVIIVTLVLLVFGTATIFISEGRNASTIGGFPLWKKLINSFFQSVTCRTAGFDSIGQAQMTDESKLLSVILMMIGGASGSTAGGIKVVTMGVIVLSVVSSLKANEKIVVFGRRISPTAVNNAMMLFALWFLLIIGASLFISRIGNFSMIDSMYEAASAYGTAGLSVGVTAAANVPVKLLLIAYMFFGRVGVTTISLVFITRKRAQEKISYPEGKVIIG